MLCQWAAKGRTPCNTTRTLLTRAATKALVAIGSWTWHGRYWLVSFLALCFGPPGSFLLTFGLLCLLSWMVLNTDLKTGRAPSLAPLFATIKRLFTSR